MKRWPFLVLAAAGIALSVWLEVLHVRAYTQPSATSFCTVGETLDCTTVALSRWSVVLGVPLPFWGVLGFATLGALAWRRSAWLLPLSALGAVASIALFVLELVSIGSVCLLCEGVHALAIALFVLAWLGRRGLDVPLGSRVELFSVLVPAALVAVLLMVALPHYWGAFGWKAPPPFPHGKTPEGFPWIGAENPDLTLHEFTDYRCPHCAAAAARNLRRLSQHPSSLRIVRRQFPRQRCPSRANIACLSLRLAYCAEEQGKFWQADRWLFEHAARPGGIQAQATAMASDLKLDAAALNVCLNRPDVVQRAMREAAFAVDQKYSSTPTLVVDGKPVTEREFLNLLSD